MSKKKKSKRHSTLKEEPDSISNVTPGRSRRHLIMAITAMVVGVITVVAWLGLHPSSVTSGIELSAASQKIGVASSDDQAPKTAAGGPSIYFPEPLFDFGAIAQGDKVSHTFVVQNTGDEPLKLIKAKGS